MCHNFNSKMYKKRTVNMLEASANKSEKVLSIAFYCASTLLLTEVGYHKTGMKTNPINSNNMVQGVSH